MFGFSPPGLKAALRMCRLCCMARACAILPQDVGRRNGEGLLLWSRGQRKPALRTTLMRWVAWNKFSSSVTIAKSASDYIRELESGSSLEVDGYLGRPIYGGFFQLHFA